MLTAEKIHSYVITLQNSKNYNSFQTYMKDISLEPRTQLGVQGNLLDKNQLTDLVYPSVFYYVENGRNLDSQIASLGAIGCYLSHIKLWKQLVESDQEMYLIFEDDAVPTNLCTLNAIQSILNSVKHQDDNWGIIFLGWYKFHPDFKSLDKKLQNGIYKTYDRMYGTHSYIIHKRGAKILLEKSLPIVDQLDSYISFMFISDQISSYRPTHCLFKQNKKSGSSIQTDNFSALLILNRMGEIKVRLSLLILFTFFLFFIYQIGKKMF